MHNWRNPQVLTRIGLTALLLASVVAGFTHAADANHKRGIVRAKFGDFAYIGDIDDTSEPDNYVVTLNTGQSVKLNKQNSVVTYFASDADEFRAKMSMLKPNDANGRLALAREALTKKQPELASEAIAAAKKIDPKNGQIPGLEKQLAALSPPATTQAAAPDSQPATEKKEVGAARRTLTAEEVQLVRARETGLNEKVRYQVPPDMKKKLVESKVATMAEVRSLNVSDLASFVMTRGTEEQKKEVKIVDDPAALVEFRQKINKPVIAGCAAAKCHGGTGGGRLHLFANDRDEASALTNFVSLQKFEKNIGGVQRFMIDRLYPQNSMLLSYSLPESLSRVPHPKVDGFVPLFRTEKDPLYTIVSTWLTNALNVRAGGYSDIDLTTPAPKK